MAGCKVILSETIRKLRKSEIRVFVPSLSNEAYLQGAINDKPNAIGGAVTLKGSSYRPDSLTDIRRGFERRNGGKKQGRQGRLLAGMQSCLIFFLSIGHHLFYLTAKRGGLL